MRQSAAHFGIPWSRYRLIWVAELAAAAGVVIGLWWHPLGVASAAGMALLLVGALITHRRAEDGGEGDHTGLARPARSPTWPSPSPPGRDPPPQQRHGRLGHALPVRMNWHCGAASSSAGRDSRRRDGRSAARRAGGRPPRRVAWLLRTMPGRPRRRSGTCVRCPRMPDSWCCGMRTRCFAARCPLPASRPAVARGTVPADPPARGERSGGGRRSDRRGLGENRRPQRSVRSG